jgi:hypothetical protein
LMRDVICRIVPITKFLPEALFVAVDVWVCWLWVFWDI